MQIPASNAITDEADLPLPCRYLKQHDVLIGQLNGTRAGIQEGTSTTA